ncbi:phosphomevalonate kinase, peroxisomal isoform X3 [Humulus lupulus]|uniref:phosphomevalonate kinase, peroxisomal isoform X3 n=1 Tax=Humulus lupulus TaxID=3486 RepID=UPI002B40F1ED|nr:phosphomevalonate kinase, peroxisomal isoform X3 [Humulus lupulus]
MAVVVSAPGKVLMTGGYLILERPNPGLVLSTSARFYAIVKPLLEEIKPDSWAWAWTDVKVTSPQLNRESMYKLSMKNLTLQSVSRQVYTGITEKTGSGSKMSTLNDHPPLCFVTKESGNPFVEQAVQYSVAAAYATADKDRKEVLQKLLLQGLDITILGSNDFYSYRNQIEARGLPLLPESLAALPPFASITFNSGESSGENSKPEVAKTGLGSSAAMTSSVVAALLHYLGVVDLAHVKGTADLDVVHIIAQTAHCIAQGKVGSGFDVSSAVYGSHRYVRFSPKVISSAQVAIKGAPLGEVVIEILKGKWDHERTKLSLPPLMNLLLGEPGTGGSSTPSMVGAVKKWQKSNPEKSQETWTKLSEANSALETQLNTLCKLAEEHWDEYKKLINNCGSLKPEKWMEQATQQSQEVIAKVLLGARVAMLGIRYHMRLMGEAAGIPIEPSSQTQLLDSTMNMEGVLLAGVPGAGGFDAVFAVTLGESSNHVIKSWSSQNVLAMLVREDPRGVSLEATDPRTSEITSSISSVKMQVVLAHMDLDDALLRIDKMPSSLTKEENEPKDKKSLSHIHLHLSN